MGLKRKAKKNAIVSIIIPAFCQERTIVKDIQRIKNVLRRLPYNWEMIIVVDGMVDGTFHKAKRMRTKNIKVVGYENNHGKGYAIRYGMVRSKGHIVGFIDSGMDLNPRGLSRLIDQLEKEEMDIVIGSKRHTESKVLYPFYRKVISVFSQLFIRILFGLNVRDTQVGMKFFRRQVLETVFPRLLVKQFAFDIEILVVAYYLGYRKIGEAPVEITYNFGKSFVSQNLFSAVKKTFWDSLAIFYRLKILHYYDDASERKWKFDPELDFKVNIG